MAVRIGDFKILRRGLRTKTPGNWEVYDLQFEFHLVTQRLRAGLHPRLVPEHAIVSQQKIGSICGINGNHFVRLTGKQSFLNRASTHRHFDDRHHVNSGLAVFIRRNPSTSQRLHLLQPKSTAGREDFNYFAEGSTTTQGTGTGVQPLAQTLDHYHVRARQSNDGIPFRVASALGRRSETVRVQSRSSICDENEPDGNLTN